MDLIGPKNLTRSKTSVFEPKNVFFVDNSFAEHPLSEKIILNEVSLGESPISATLPTGKINTTAKSFPSKHTLAPQTQSETSTDKKNTTGKCSPINQTLFLDRESQLLFLVAQVPAGGPSPKKENREQN